MHASKLTNYDEHGRHREVVRNLERKLEIAERKLRAKYCPSNTSAASGSSENKSGGDLVKIQLEQLSHEVTQFNSDVANFSSPQGHFTKEYRALITKSRDLQSGLDRIKIDATQRRDDFELKKSLICIVGQAVSDINSKVHEDGELCKKCPVKNI